MSSPNYSYCAEYCNGRLPNCPHYVGRFGGLCNNYKELLKGKNSRGEISRTKLEIIVENLRKEGL